MMIIKKHSNLCYFSFMWLLNRLIFRSQFFFANSDKITHTAMILWNSMQSAIVKTTIIAIITE